MKLLKLIILVLICSQNVMVADSLTSLSRSDKKACWKLIKDHLVNEKGEALRYHDSIRVSLRKGFSVDDSVFVAELIEEVKPLLGGINIDFVDKNGNYDFSLRYIEDKTYGADKSYTTGPEKKLKYMHVKYVVFNSTLPEYKRNTIKHHFIRELVQENKKSDEDKRTWGDYSGIWGNGFVQNSEFTLKDRYILKSIYSPEFDQLLKSNYPGGIMRYWLFKYGADFKRIVRIVYVFLCVILLMFYIRIGAFEKNSRKYSIFISQAGQVMLLLMLIQGGEYYLVSETNFNENVSFWHSLMLILFPFLLCAHVVYFGDWLVHRWFKDRLKQAVQVFISTTSSLLVFYVIYFVFLSAQKDNIHKWVFFNSYFLSISLLVFAIGLVRSYVVYLNNRKRERAIKLELQFAKLEKLKQQAELQALHSRINPHFLYNSLNSIASLAHEDADKTEQMALSLSDFCRSAINKQNKDTATIAEEVEIVLNYLEIEKVRLGDRLNYKLNVEEGINEREVPRFVLQPLVENAIKHGVAKITGRGEIHIEVLQKSDSLLLSIYDNGPAFPDDLISGYGLQSLFDKLEILYQGKAKLVWQNAPTKCINVVLPKDTQLVK